MSFTGHWWKKLKNFTYICVCVFDSVVFELKLLSIFENFPSLY